MPRHIVIALVFAALLALPLYAQSPYAQFDDCPCAYLGVGVPWKEYVEPAKLAALIDGKAEPYILVDVRTPEEYAAGHIRTAINIPLDIIATSPPTADKDALIILYCKSGRRSAAAMEKLKEQGYRGVIDFGSMANWPGPLETGSVSP